MKWWTLSKSEKEILIGHLVLGLQRKGQSMSDRENLEKLNRLAEEVSNSSCMDVECDDCPFQGPHNCLVALIVRNAGKAVQDE